MLTENPSRLIEQARRVYYATATALVLGLVAASSASAGVTSGTGSSSGGSGSAGSTPALVTTITGNLVAILATVATAAVAYATLPKLIDGLRKHNVSAIMVSLLLGGLVFYVASDPTAAFTKVSGFASDLAK